MNQNQNINRRYTRKSIATRKRHLVEIQEKSEANDLENELVESWRAVATAWASIEPIKAVQQFQNRSIGVDATHLVIMDALTSINEFNRLVFNGRSFEILSIENLQERNFDLVITCKEVR